MKVVQLIAENVKKLKAVLIKPEGNVIKISGDNEQGKTTVLDCIWWALGGTKNIQDMPIRAGEKKAKISLDLGDMIVTRKFTESGSTLEVTNKEGAVYKSPQAILDNIVGKLSFDPLAFSKSKKDEQVQTLLKIVDLKHDREKLEGIAGIPFVAGATPIIDINNAYSAVYSSRTSVNSEVSMYEGQLKQYENTVETEPVVVTELIAERDRLQAINTGNDQYKAKGDKLASDLKSSLIAAERKKNEINSTVMQIERLKKLLEQQESELRDIAKSVKAADDILAIHNNTVAELKDEDLTEINQKIANADKQNRDAKDWETKQKIISTLNEKKEKSESMTDTLEKIKEYKENLIAEAKFPIHGMGFNSDGVTIDGIPFEQCSASQKIKVSVGVAMALNPTLRVIRIDDGSLLGPKNMAIIEEMAKENDYQIWMEVVDVSGKVGIYIEDGEVKTAAEQTKLDI